MRKFNNTLKDYGYVLYRWIHPLADPIRLFKAIPGYVGYLHDMITYARLKGSERIRLGDTYPCLHDSTPTTPFDSHYFYQDAWAFKKIAQSSVRNHVDVGSRIDFVGHLSAICKVTFIDIRPIDAKLENLESRYGSILQMPFDDGTVGSLSCLHVAEHIGLGRYGDPLDPFGTKKACVELSRVLAVGGYLYFSLPVGKQRLCFNSHRIHSPEQILEYFKTLELVELSGVDDNCNFVRNIDLRILQSSDYACGLFHFTKQ
jgi:hypothetical protein